MPLFFLGTREWRNRQTRTVQVRVPVMEWGFNSPLAHDETADPSGSAVFVFPGCCLWPRWCSGRRVWPGCFVGVIGHYVLLVARLFGFLVRESRCFSWLGPTMRMDKSCCWEGDFSALLRGKVAFLVGRVCLVSVNTASCPVCGCPMIRHGRTSSGRQRWRCKPCKITTLNEIDSTAKHLD